MLKNLLNSCFDAYRGSHKSVVAGRHIATDISFPTGYENVNATTYVPPCDGMFVIQCEPAEGYAYYNLTVRRDQLDCGFVGSYGQTWPVLEILAERAKRFTGTRGLMELLRTSRRTSAFTHTSALNVCFGGASYR